LLINKITPELAEICGIHVGDGYLRDGGKRIELDISGHIGEDRNYYDTHVAPLFYNVFEIQPTLREFPARGTYGFVIRERKIVKYFHNFLIFPFGKKARIVRVPQIVMRTRDKETYGSFLRGLFDTDGCLTFQRRYGAYVPFKKYHNVYPRIILSTVSGGLAPDLGKVLEFLGIHYWIQTYESSNKKWARVFKIWMCGEKTLEKWMGEIGFKNPVQFTRYDIWKKLGFCPPNTTLDERVQMLKGIKDN